MKVPFIDLKQGLLPIRDEIDRGFKTVLDQCSFVMGPALTEFEQQFAQFCKSPHAVGVGNGTDALHMALRAAKVGAGDEVLVPANSFIATAEGVTLAGARPALVDVDPGTFLLDTERLEEKISSKTRAVIPVHLYGRMMDLSPVVELCQKHKLVLIEDAAQAQGAEFQGKRAGSLGDFGCFSFYPGKNLGAFGDAGAVITGQEGFFNTLKYLRDHGSEKKYQHSIFGFNSRLDSLQAVVLSAKLKHLDENNKARYGAAKKYVAHLEGTGDLQLPEVPEPGSHIFHLFVLQTQRRDDLLNFLREHEIGVGIHYPVPIHLHGAYKELGHKKGDFPVSEKMADRILSLPMFPEISDDQIDYVCNKIKTFF